ncbi:hypothetical protein MHBO_002637 [Bonamia ostreae]|uniref:Thioredoxin domain-containing protein n=1 Tax=Bonamia ostreae TaxID=126728 RepID=A0ABV2ANY2_9EUKA
MAYRYILFYNAPWDTDSLALRDRLSSLFLKYNVPIYSINVDFMPDLDKLTKRVNVIPFFVFSKQGHMLFYTKFKDPDIIEEYVMKFVTAPDRADFFPPVIEEPPFHIARHIQNLRNLPL